MTFWVADTSPLIFLAHLERLDLLRAEARQVCIPQAVLAEVRAVQDSCADEIALACADWLDVREVTNRDEVEALPSEMHLGEAEALTLAKNLGAERFVVDDLVARRVAGRLGLQVVGTLGLLMAARIRGELPSLRSEFEQLLQRGFRVSPALLASALAHVGEGDE